PTPAPSPATVAAVPEIAFARAGNLAEAQDFTRKLTHTHYENFSVISLLLPKHLRQDFCNIYAFCRIADDLGDEVGDTGESLRLLDRFRDDLYAAYHGKPSTAVYMALAHTTEKF